jgi:hypothetical protein
VTDPDYVRPLPNGGWIDDTPEARVAYLANKDGAADE